jgi:hypothetical protein
MEARRIRNCSIVVLAIGLSAGAVAAAADDPPGHDDPAAQRLEQQAIDLIGRANRRVVATHPSCRPRFTRGRPRVVEGGAGPEVASVLGVFRRPATADEQAFAAQVATGRDGAVALLGGGSYGRDAVRLVTAPSGRSVALIAMTGVPPSGPSRAVFDRCHALVTSELRRLAPTVRPAVAAKAQRLERQLRRTERPPAVQRPGEGLVVIDRLPDGRTSGAGGTAPFSAARFAARGTASSTDVRGIGARLTLVVPDGVATIDATFPRVVSRGPIRARRRFPSTVRRTFTVRDNVAFATVPRPAEDAFPRMVWRAADGTVVRRVPNP